MFDENDDILTKVGYLINGKFTCLNCAETDWTAHWVKVFLVNILPYKQTCSNCGKLIVKSPTMGWPILFD